MTPALSTRLVPSDHMAHLLTVGGAYAACAVALLAVSLLWDAPPGWTLEPVCATVAFVLACVAILHLKDAVGPSVQLWRVRQALATPRFREVFTTQVRNLALDHLANGGFNIDRLQGQQVYVETEWVCRRVDLYPLIVRVVLKGSGSPNSLQNLLDNPGNHQLLWKKLGLPGTGLKPFALHTTFGPVPVGTAHAQMERARMRMG
jgi:hypothetical protein